MRTIEELVYQKLGHIVRNIPLDRLEQICNAERDGRVDIRPCKLGDMVSAEVVRPYNRHGATIHGKVTDVQTVVRVQYNSCRHVDFFASDFGKTVFLTEAEAALEMEAGE